MDRSARREMVFKLLYSIEIQKESNEEVINLFIENNEIEDKEDRDYVYEMGKGIEDNHEKIDKYITDNLKKEWDLSRVSKVNVALLKLAIYEIVFKEVPFKVVINEVVELAKSYGEDTSSSFINGILANIVKES